MNLTSQIHDMVEYLEESEKLLLVEIIKRFIPDDIATPEDLADIAIARAELARGETVAFDEIDWD